MSGYGSLYYEGREQELRFAKYTPGKMSEALKDALGVHTAHTPLPWLFNMQRYGPPPAYPGLRIPGVNCPIPLGADYGHGVGGWGAPPVDAHGQPLWGDLGAPPEEEQWDSGNWTTYLWGDMDPSGKRIDDDEQMDEASDDEDAPQMVPMDNSSAGLLADMSGVQTPGSVTSGITSTPSIGMSGTESTGSVDLRKGIESAQGGSFGTKPYKVLQQTIAADVGARNKQFFQSSTLYDVQGALETVIVKLQILIICFPGEGGRK